MTADPSRLAIMPGDIVGEKFMVGQMIGRGGMSVVYEARHIQLGQHVAVKVLNGVSTSSGTAFEQVLMEAQATARLTSEHVVRVIDVGISKGGFGYVVMERLTGHDLAEEVRRGTRMRIEEAVKLVLEACHGLAEAHAAGFVHRDIKPSNLFLSQKPDKTVTLKVLDFGLARAESTNSTTARGSQRGPRIAGSPGYASPEQLGTAGDADARADVWGLGVVLYELISGQRPFEAANLAEALVAAATLPMPPLVSPHGPVPREFENVVRRCLEKDREDRYPSVLALAEALAPHAPPAYWDFADRVRAVGGRTGWSVGTIRTVQSDGSAATVGTFSTDTFSPDSMPPSTGAPSSVLAPPSSVHEAGSGQGFVVASMVQSRRVAMGLALVLCLVAGLYFGGFRLGRGSPVTPAAPPQPSALAAPSALGPLGPLAPLGPLGSSPQPLAPLAAPPPPPPPAADTGSAVQATLELPPTTPTHKKTPKTPGGAGSAKPAGNPMTYR